MKLDALENPVDIKDAKVFLEQHPVKRTFFNASKDIIGGIVLLISIAVVLLFVMKDVGAIGWAFAGAVLLIALVSVSMYFYYHQAYALKNAEIGLRVERFAKDNGWLYSHREAIFKHATTFFTAGHDYEFMNVVSGYDFEAGQFAFTTGSGRSEKRHLYGYMIVPLQRNMPHMLLDGKSNNMRAFGMDISNIPVNFHKNQIDLLEGDFNDHYTLYAPEGYGVDVRYIFTPDLMQILVEESDSIDIEIMDNNVFVYFGKHDVGSRVFWQRVDTLRAAFHDKLVTKSLRYDDDRTVDGSISRQGWRLKRRVPIVLVILAILVYALETHDFIVSFFNLGR